MDPVAPTSSAPPRRRYGRWIVVGAVILMTPMLALALAVWSTLTLDRDTALLRREVMKATGSEWHTKVQVHLGWLALGTVRTVLPFVHHRNIEDARMALAAVRQATAGVYERNEAGRPVPANKLFGDTDRLMHARGWTRLVGVVDDKQSVLIYTSDNDSGDKLEVCLAVVDGNELVVASTKVDAEALAALVAKHTPADFKTKLKFPRLNF